MIDHVDRPVEKTYPAPPNDFSVPLPGPEVAVLKKRLPPRLCAALRSRAPGDVEPDESPKLVRIALQVIATLEREHYGRGGAELTELKVLRYETGAYMREHRDITYEGAVFPSSTTAPTGLVPYAVQFYASEPGVHYDGGVLVVGDQRIQPALGIVVAIRGDVLHRVEPVTRGVRVAVKAVMGADTDLR